MFSAILVVDLLSEATLNSAYKIPLLVFYSLGHSVFFLFLFLFLFFLSTRNALVGSVLPLRMGSSNCVSRRGNVGCTSCSFDVTLMSPANAVETWKEGKDLSQGRATVMKAKLGKPSQEKGGFFPVRLYCWEWRDPHDL